MEALAGTTTRQAKFKKPRSDWTSRTVILFCFVVWWSDALDLYEISEYLPIHISIINYEIL